MPRRDQSVRRTFGIRLGFIESYRFVDIFFLTVCLFIYSWSTRSDVVRFNNKNYIPIKYHRHFTCTPPLTLTHSRSLTRTPSLALPHSHSLTHAPSLALPHSHTLTHTPSLTLPHSHSLTHTPSFTFPHSHSSLTGMSRQYSNSFSYLLNFFPFSKTSVVTPPTFHQRFLQWIHTDKCMTDGPKPPASEASNFCTINFRLQDVGFLKKQK